MPTSSLARAAATFTVAALLTLSTCLPAGAAAVPTTPSPATGWNVATTIGPAEGVWTENLSASGPDDAWSTWNACTSCSSPPVNVSYVEHWDGSAWAQVPVPGSLAKYAANPLAVSSSSASNAWLFDPGKTLRWNGTAWALHSQPAWVVHSNLGGEYDVTAQVFSPTSAWVFSLGVDSFTSPDHYAATWNGHAWSKVIMPGVPDWVSVVSADDIWALGPTPATALKNKPTDVLMHWDGTSWSSTALPKVTIPKGTTEGPGGLAADSATQAWVPWYITKGTAGAKPAYLLELNGTTWSKVSIKYPTISFNAIAQDGHGGLWMAADGPAPDFTSYFYHLNGTSWTKEAVPAAAGMGLLEISGLTWVPGTQSMWAPADMTEGNNIYGAILGYGD
jgi:hypothetical protein